MRVIDTVSGACKATMRGHEHVVECAVFVPVAAHKQVAELTKVVIEVCVNSGES